jgi:hypothetical protein
MTVVGDLPLFLGEGWDTGDGRLSGFGGRRSADIRIRAAMRKT